MVLSLVIPNNLVLTMSSLRTTLSERWTQDLETRHYYVLCTLFPLPGYLDDQHSEFLESWMAYLISQNFLTSSCSTTIGKGALLKEEYTTIESHTLLMDINNFMYLTQSNFTEDTPNQILHMLSTLVLWLKSFYTTIGQYPTLFDFLAIT